MAERRSTALEVLKVPEYRNFIIARFFYIMALRMVTTIVGWRIYEITHNPFAIGLIGLSEFLPAFAWRCMRDTSSTKAIKGRCS